jgi:hypothetical protein
MKIFALATPKNILYRINSHYSFLLLRKTSDFSTPLHSAVSNIPQLGDAAPTVGDMDASAEDAHL